MPRNFSSKIKHWLPIGYLPDCVMRAGSILFLLLISSCTTEIQTPIAFQILTPEKSNIHFKNTLTETEDFNIIQYLYFYNGGGVAAGDINNDGLPDLIFSGNQVGNKLYLNKGNLQFADITTSAGIACKTAWNTGVNFVDINNDGWLDLYICQLGDYINIKGRNQLFINNQNNTFSERAAAYGLAFQGFSTQSAFFDYDQDGDLDLYLLNHSVHDPSNYRDTTNRNVVDKLAGDRLFKNENGQFIDVTSEAGILSSKIGFGLGVAIADLNNDGCGDIYVSNDFHENDYLYYNNCDGTFTEGIAESMMHLSQFSMGSDIADFNNDALPDVMTLDMKPELESVLKNSVGADAYDIFEFKHDFGYHYQYPRNMLQLNRGQIDGQTIFSEIGQLAGVAATDWSWSTLMLDFDNDGWKDIFVSNGIVRRPNDLDYLKFISSPQVQQDASDLSMAQKMPVGNVPNYFFKNNEDLRFIKVNEDWELQENSISNGAAYADLDLDGDLDIITNNINQVASVYENKIAENNFIQFKLKGKEANHFSIGAKVWLYTDYGIQYQQLSPTRGFMSGSDYTLTFGVAEAEMIDSVIIRWNTGNQKTIYDLKTNQLYKFEEPQEKAENKITETKPIFKDITEQFNFDHRHRENTFYDNNRENLIPYLLSTQGPAAAVADVNGDGLDDFFIGGAKQQSGVLFIQMSDGTFDKQTQRAWKNDRIAEDTDALFFDADGDQDQDLYVVSGGNEFPRGSQTLVDRLYLNDGQGQFTLSQGNLRPKYENGSCVRAADFDQDGDLDLFIGNRSVPGEYGATPPSFLLENSNGKFKDVTNQKLPDLSKLGMVTDALWLDIDQNGFEDLVVVGEWMPVTIFKNEAGKFNSKTEVPNSAGWYQSIAAHDFNGDEFPDLVLGNFGTNNNLQPNSESPIQLFIKDFDENKSPEAILTFERSGKTYTFASKDELVRRMASFRKQYPEYKIFSERTFSEIFSAEQLENAEQKTTNRFDSYYLENKAGKNFIDFVLPVPAQFSTANALLIEDFNQDGNEDVLLAGNFLEIQPNIGRQDASIGTLLIGNGSGHFQDVAPSEINLKLSGAIRKLLPFKGPNGERRILVIENKGAIRVLEY